MFHLSKIKKDAGASTSSGRNSRRNSTPAILRLAKDLNDLDLPPTCKTEFPNPDNLSSFNVIISPDEGYYKSGKFFFTFEIGDDYPIMPPTVKCSTPIYHPNIDMRGNICLNILKKDWNPVLSINSMILGLLFLFMEPNVADPLNEEAANALKQDPALFQSKVNNTIRVANLDTTGRLAPRVRRMIEALEQQGSSD